MDPAYWQRLQGLFEEAVGLDPDERSAYLRRICGDDRGLLEDALSLLEAHDGADSDWSRSPRPLVGAGEMRAPYQPGDRVGHYRIDEQIGKGGMGVVYRARDTRLQRDVALKFLPASLHGDAASRQRFMAEARSASRLDHPNICVIHDVDDTPEGHMYIAMPHYEGETLAARLKRGRIAVADTLPVAIQVADGLTAAHALDIVHRDVKPANIMLTGQGVVKILDFGVAKVADTNLTGSGMGVGTLAYMAPEQMHGRDVDGRADIWALGVTVHEMLTGKPVFDGEGAIQIVEAVLDENEQRERPLPGEVPEAMHAVVERTLQRNRSERYPDMASLLEDLIQIRAMLAADNGATRTSSVSSRHGRTVYEWDPDFLDSMIDALVPVLGPITWKLVRRTARRASDLDALCAALCELLPEDAEQRYVTERIRVTAAMNTTPPSPDRISTSNPSTQVELSPLQLARMEACLLPHVGPIAATVIRRASTAATDRQAFARLVSDSVADPGDRASLAQRIEAILDRDE